MSEPVKLRAHNQAHCKDCSLAPLCLPLSLNLEDMDALDDIVKRGRPLKKGEFLFRQGDTFDCVYAVRSVCMVFDAYLQQTNQQRFSRVI